MNRKARIESLIINEIKPEFFLIKDVSEEHRGHRSFKDGVESHFDITVVTDKFSDKNKIERHRIINKLLKEEFLLDLHSVTLKAYSLKEYNKG